MSYIPYELPKVEIGGQVFERVQMEHHVLQQRRKELNLTQQQVADQARIQLRQYQRLESGVQSMNGTSSRILFSVCKVLRLNPEFLLGLSTMEKIPEIQRMKHIILPPIDDNGIYYQIPQYAYFLLVSEIPCGRIAGYESIKETLGKAYNQPDAEINSDMNSYRLHDSMAFPYWRVVSERGHLLKMTYTYKESQKDLLEKEGLKIEKEESRDSYVVADYKKYLFSFDSLIISVMKSPKQIAQDLKVPLKE